VAPSIGDVITTKTSAFTGTVVKVVANATGSFRVYLEDESGNGKWSTVNP